LDGAALLHFLGNATMKTNASTQQLKQTLPRSNENKRFHTAM
jgi:hypothetical protein